jgi:hypothetical protein
MSESLVLEETIDYFIKVPELENMLKQRGLSLSENKVELIKKLKDADQEQMQKRCAGLHVYRCTIERQALADQYLLGEKSKRANYEKKTSMLFIKGILLNKQKTLQVIFAPKLLCEYNR